MGGYREKAARAVSGSPLHRFKLDKTADGWEAFVILDI
jgi:hypothetical protein